MMNDLLLHGVLGSSGSRGLFKRKVWDAKDRNARKPAITLKTIGNHFSSYPQKPGSLFNRTSNSSTYPYTGPTMTCHDKERGSLFVLRNQAMGLSNAFNYPTTSFAISITHDGESFTDVATPVSWNQGIVFKFKNEVYTMGANGIAKYDFIDFKTTGVAASAYGNSFYYKPIIGNNCFISFSNAANAGFRWSTNLTTFTTQTFNSVSEGVTNNNCMVYSTATLPNSNIGFVLLYQTTGTTKTELLRLKYNVDSNTMQGRQCQLLMGYNPPSVAEAIAMQYQPFEVMCTDKSVIVLVSTGDYVSNTNTSITYGFDVYRSGHTPESIEYDGIYFSKVGSFSLENTLFTMPGNKSINTPKTMAFNLTPNLSVSLGGDKYCYDPDTGRIYYVISMIVGDTGANFFQTFGVLISDDEGASWTLKYVFDRPFTSTSNAITGNLRPFNLNIFQGRLVFSIASASAFPASFLSFFQSNLDVEEICFDLSV